MLESQESQWTFGDRKCCLLRPEHGDWGQFGQNVVLRREMKSAPLGVWAGDLLECLVGELSPQEERAGQETGLFWGSSTDIAKALLPSFLCCGNLAGKVKAL